MGRHSLVVDPVEPPPEPATVSTAFGAATDVGRIRPDNEDSYLAVEPVFIVVDGMGGHASGRLASRTAVNVLEPLADEPVTSTQQVIRAVVAAGHAVDAIPAHGARRPGAAIAGVVLAEIDGLRTWICLNIGDSRVYLLRKDLLVQVSHDHSQVQLLIDTGRLTHAQARTDPRRHVITRALGAGLGEEAVPELHLLRARVGDRVLVCSDGVTDELDDEALATVLGAGLSPQATADAVVAAALEAGGHDNTTALVVDLVLPGPPPPPTPSAEGAASAEQSEDALGPAATTAPVPVQQHT